MMRNVLLLLSLVFFSVSCMEEVGVDGQGGVVKVAESLTLKDIFIYEFGSYEEVIPTGKEDFYEAYNKVLEEWEIDFHELDIQTDWGTAHVIACGEYTNTPMVLLHGMNASSASWYPNIEELSQEYRVYAIDFPLEPGKSFVDDEFDNVEEIFTWYKQVFEKLNISEMYLVGMSKGGWLSLNLALRNSDLVKKLALISPAQTFVWLKPSLGAFENVAFMIKPKEKNLTSALGSVSSSPDNIMDSFKELYLEGLKNVTIPKFTLAMQPFSDGELEGLSMPILVMIGDEDIVNSPKSLKIAKEHISKCDTMTIHNAGHFVPLDQPEIVNIELLEFFAE